MKKTSSNEQKNSDNSDSTVDIVKQMQTIYIFIYIIYLYTANKDTVVIDPF